MPAQSHVKLGSWLYTDPDRLQKTLVLTYLSLNQWGKKSEYYSKIKQKLSELMKAEPPFAIYGWDMGEAVKLTVEMLDELDKYGISTPPSNKEAIIRKLKEVHSSIQEIAYLDLHTLNCLEKDIFSDYVINISDIQYRIDDFLKYLKNLDKRHIIFNQDILSIKQRQWLNQYASELKKIGEIRFDYKEIILDKALIECTAEVSGEPEFTFDMLKHIESLEVSEDYFKGEHRTLEELLAKTYDLKELGLEGCNIEKRPTKKVELELVKLSKFRGKKSTIDVGILNNILVNATNLEYLSSPSCKDWELLDFEKLNLSHLKALHFLYCNISTKALSRFLKKTSHIQSFVLWGSEESNIKIDELNLKELFLKDLIKVGFCTDNASVMPKICEIAPKLKKEKKIARERDEKFKSKKTASLTLPKLNWDKMMKVKSCLSSDGFPLSKPGVDLMFVPKVNPPGYAKDIKDFGLPYVKGKSSDLLLSTQETLLHGKSLYRIINQEIIKTNIGYSKKKTDIVPQIRYMPLDTLVVPLQEEEFYPVIKNIKKHTLVLMVSKSTGHVLQARWHHKDTSSNSITLDGIHSQTKDSEDRTQNLHPLTHEPVEGEGYYLVLINFDDTPYQLHKLADLHCDVGSQPKFMDSLRLTDYRVINVVCDSSKKENTASELVKQLDELAKQTCKSEKTIRKQTLSEMISQFCASYHLKSQEEFFMLVLLKHLGINIEPPNLIKCLMFSQDDKVIINLSMWEHDDASIHEGELSNLICDNIDYYSEVTVKKDSKSSGKTEAGISIEISLNSLVSYLSKNEVELRERATKFYSNHTVSFKKRFGNLKVTSLFRAPFQEFIEKRTNMPKGIDDELLGSKLLPMALLASFVDLKPDIVTALHESYNNIYGILDPLQIKNGAYSLLLYPTFPTEELELIVKQINDKRSGAVDIATHQLIKPLVNSIFANAKGLLFDVDFVDSSEFSWYLYQGLRNLLYIQNPELVKLIINEISDILDIRSSLKTIERQFNGIEKHMHDPKIIELSKVVLKLISELKNTLEGVDVTTIIKDPLAFVETYMIILEQIEVICKKRPHVPFYFDPQPLIDRFNPFFDFLKKIEPSLRQISFPSNLEPYASMFFKKPAPKEERVERRRIHTAL